MIQVGRNTFRAQISLSVSGYLILPSIPLAYSGLHGYSELKIVLANLPVLLAKIRLSRQMCAVRGLSGQKCLKRPVISIYWADLLDNQ